MTLITLVLAGSTVAALVWALVSRRALSHRRRELESLYDDRQRYRSMLEITSEGFWIIHPETKQTLEVNSALSAMLGYDEEEMLGKTPMDFVDAENAEIFKRQTGKIGVTDQRIYEITLLRKDGSPLPTMFGATTLRHEDGSPRLAFAFVTDLTEIKMVEAELKETQASLEKQIEDRTAHLRESEERFRSLYEKAPLPYQSLDNQGNIIEVNDAWLDLLGHERNAVIGHPITEFLDPADHAYLQENLGRFLATGEVHGIEINILRSDGSTRRVSVEGRLGRPHDGAEPQTHCILTDVTMQRLAEGELRRSEEKYRRLVEEIQQEYFIYSHDTEGVFTCLSPSINAILGYDQRDFMTHFSTYLTDNPVNELVEAHTARSIAGDKQPPYKVEILHKNGAVRMLEVSESPIFDAAGKVVAVEGIAHDITDKKEDEKRLLRTVEELTQSNVELERFAYVASHDLQEPLRGIVSFAQILQRRYGEVLDQDGRDYLNHMADGAQRMNNLVQGLLQYSRASGRDMPYTCFDMSEVLLEVLSDLRESIGASGARVTHAVLPEVRADRLHMAMVLQNLVGNAIKYRDPQIAPKVHVDCEKTPEGWCFTVSDNGIGIEPKHHDRIFEIFSAPARGVELSGHRHRIVPVQTHRRTPRRADLGRFRSRRRRGVPFHPAGRGGRPVGLDQAFSL